MWIHVLEHTCNRIRSDLCMNSDCASSCLQLVIDETHNVIDKFCTSTTSSLFISKNGTLTQILRPLLSILFDRFQGLIVCHGKVFSLLFLHQMLLFPIKLSQYLFFL